MTISAMRNYISGMYDSEKWRQRVHGMHENQVIAIYKTMKKRGQKPQPPKPMETPKFKQISMFDF